ncbi:MAG TPA: RNA 2',3'-cyclic phosphodiesterase [Clostridiales bacterium]|nr:RNA 2',3'-cyclic phosphodiesterase [Clostridiales bacterium]
MEKQDLLKNEKKHKGNLFTALTFSKGEVEKIYEHLEKIVDDKNKLTAREKIHLTLVYIGKTDNEQAIIEVLSEIDFESFDITISGISKMPRLNIYVFNVVENEKLIELKKLIDAKLEKANISFNKRENFYPHITISRKNIKYKKTDFSLKLKISKFDLIASIPIPGNVKYETLYTNNFKN